MKIAIDIDEVLRETVAGFCVYYNKNYGGRIRLPDFQACRISEVFGISPEEAHRLLDEYCVSEDFKSVNIVRYADEVVSILGKSHELIAVTASPSWMKDLTWEFFDKHFSGCFSNLIFSGECYPESNDKSKDIICEELGVDLIIEDSPFSQDYAKGGLKVLLLDKPWNKNLSHKNLVRCSDWREILGEIRRMEDG